MDQATLKNLLDYNSETGVFTWRVSRPPRGRPGQQAGHDNGNGYVRLSVLGKKYYAHRLAFVWMLNEFPNNVDHINGNTIDNRWCNLRSVSQSVNMANTVHGKGVSFRYGKWHARYSSKELGSFESREEAEACYLKEKARAAGLIPFRTQKGNLTKVKQKHVKRTYLGQSLSHWARVWSVPQPTLHHQIVVQGRSFEEIAAIRDTTK